MRPGGGGDLPDRDLPNVPDRVDPSRADRHPIHPVRERSDSRSRRVPLRLVPLLVRLLRMKKGIPLDRLRPVLPIGRRGVSTAPLKD